MNNSNDGYQSYVDHELKRIRNEGNLSRNSGLSSGSGAAEGQGSGSAVEIGKKFQTETYLAQGLSKVEAEVNIKALRTQENLEKRMSKINENGRTN